MPPANPARFLRLLMASVYLSTSLIALAVAAWYADDIVGLLPELVVGTEAVSGAAMALSVLFAVIGATHFALRIGLSRGRRWAQVTAGVAGLGLAIALGCWAVAALVTGLTQPQAAMDLWAVAAVLAVMAVVEGYLAATATRGRRMATI